MPEIDPRLRSALKASAMASRASAGLMMLNGKPHKNVQYCHELVRSTAKELAAAIYEDGMRDNQNYEMWKRMCPDLPLEKMQEEFVKQMWPRMLDDARATLAKMLAGDCAQSLKDIIYSALILDGQLRAKDKTLSPLFRL